MTRTHYSSALSVSAAELLVDASSWPLQTSQVLRRVAEADDRIEGVDAALIVGPRLFQLTPALLAGELRA